MSWTVNFILEDIVVGHVYFLVGRTLRIVPRLQPDTNVGSADTTAGICSAGVRVRHSTAMGERSARSTESITPLLSSSAETDSLPPASPNPERERRTASLDARGHERRSRRDQRCDERDVKIP
jgi:hypothetical protein